VSDPWLDQGLAQLLRWCRTHADLCRYSAALRLNLVCPGRIRRGKLRPGWEDKTFLSCWKEKGQMEFLSTIYFSILNCPPVMCISLPDEKVRDNTDNLANHMSQFLFINVAFILLGTLGVGLFDTKIFHHKVKRSSMVYNE
jgi:hypothetical protein